MSLLDASLVALLAIPCVFFMGTAWAYCRHANSVVKNLRANNRELQAKYSRLVTECHNLEEDNIRLHRQCEHPQCPQPKSVQGTT